jgi:hypothetical protein
MSKFAGTCVNDSGAPITIWGFTPHMHKLGRHMNSVVRRKDGTMERVFDRAFDFNAQIPYPVNRSGTVWHTVTSRMPSDRQARRLLANCSHDTTRHDTVVRFQPARLVRGAHAVWLSD